MAHAKIFLVNNQDNGLDQMIETEYVNESKLQELLARYPDLLPGDQIDEENPRRWLLIAREMGVPSESDSGDRWSLDHLFIDQDGMPTFVECKRATDTRIKREVVAQMLDYAANGIEYWGHDRLREKAGQTYGADLDQKIRELLQPNESNAEAIEKFWQLVETNLRNGHVRLIFVADELPRELRRLIEFLNEHMPEVEVLGVEIKQFVGKAQKALVPRVIGATETARINRGAQSGRSRSTEESFLAKCSQDSATFFKGIVDLANERGHRVYWGTVGFSIGAQLTKQQIDDGQFASFAYGYPKTGNYPCERFEFYFALLPLSESQEAELRAELMKYGVFRVAGERTLRVLLDKSTLPQMHAVYDFILERIDAIHHSAASMSMPENTGQ